MTTATVLAWLVGALLTAAALLTLVRVTIGPSVLDRVVALDVLVSIVVCALGAHVALTDGSSTLTLLISLSLVGFLGSVAVARFVARDRDPEPEPGPEDDPEPDPESRPGLPSAPDASSEVER